jgi:hypothetical protein
MYLSLANPCIATIVRDFSITFISITTTIIKKTFTIINIIIIIIVALLTLLTSLALRRVYLGEGKAL